jgi:hypothetical protein
MSASAKQLAPSGMAWFILCINARFESTLGTTDVQMLAAHVEPAQP